MSTSTNQTQTVAFLGATGGCTLPVLERTLKSGNHATALARNPEKLRKLLVETHSVPESLVASNLRIIAGSASDTSAVRNLLVASPQQKTLVDTLVSGIGSLPKVNWSNPLKPFTLEDPHVTETAMRSVEQGLKSLIAEGYRSGREERPLVVAISTTGVSKQKRDVPVAFLPFYHWALAVPHKDKRIMEDMVVAAKKEGIIRDYVLIRPSLLVDGQVKGLYSVRAGWESDDGTSQGPGPAVGYVITKEDVGAWIWEEAVQKNNQWKGKAVSLTY